jgi:hypothetical protein
VAITDGRRSGGGGGRGESEGADGHHTREGGGGAISSWVASFSDRAAGLAGEAAPCVRDL